MSTSPSLLHGQPTGQQTTDPSPIRVVVVDVSKRGARQAYERFEGILQQSEDVELAEQSSFWVTADSLGLDEGSFRDSGKRRQQHEALVELMRQLGLESIVLMGVSSSGGKIQMVFMGPGAQELAYVGRDIEGGEVDRTTALSMLKEGFTPLIPTIQRWRQQQQQLSASAPAEDDAAAGDTSAAEEPGVTEEQEPLESSGEIPAFRVGAGAFFGRRTLLIQKPSSSLQPSYPFFGAWGEGAATLARFSGGTASFGVEAHGGYGAFSIGLAAGEAPADGSVMMLGGGAFVRRALSPTLALEGRLGVELNTVILPANRVFTGSKVWMAPAGVAARLELAEVVEVSVGGYALPVLQASLSSDAYGTSGFSVGARGSGQAAIDLTDSLAAQGSYTFTYLAPSYPEPPGLQAPVTSEDVIHLGALTLTLHF